MVSIHQYYSRVSTMFPVSSSALCLCCKIQIQEGAMAGYNVHILKRGRGYRSTNDSVPWHIYGREVLQGLQG